MQVLFRKTGVRRYGVLVERAAGPALMMHPAPGYDDFLPHDLLHFVAEAEWGIDGAVFGRLAAGGDAGTFWPVDHDLLRKFRRRRKRVARGRPRGRRSELLAGVLEAAWNARHGRAPLPDDWESRLAAVGVEPARLDGVLVSLDALAEQWRALEVGESLKLEWPRRERRVHSAQTRGPRGVRPRR